MEEVGNLRSVPVIIISGARWHPLRVQNEKGSTLRDEVAVAMGARIEANHRLLGAADRRLYKPDYHPLAVRSLSRFTVDDAHRTQARKHERDSNISREVEQSRRRTVVLGECRQ